jgi:hypothetical protein
MSAQKGKPKHCLSPDAKKAFPQALAAYRLIKKTIHYDLLASGGAFVFKVEYPGYDDAIKTPMWLEEISRKLEKGEYKNLEEVEKDEQQIWKNAKAFNGKKHPIHKRADEYERRFLSEWLTVREFHSGERKERKRKGEETEHIEMDCGSDSGEKYIVPPLPPLPALQQPDPFSAIVLSLLSLKDVQARKQQNFPGPVTPTVHPWFS